MLTEARDPKAFLAELREDPDSDHPLKAQCVQEEIALVMNEYGEYRVRDRCFTDYLGPTNFTLCRIDICE
eukprot:6144074-Pleurochrysis_carterae.AAC.1